MVILSFLREFISAHPFHLPWVLVWIPKLHGDAPEFIYTDQKAKPTPRQQDTRRDDSISVELAFKPGAFDQGITPEELALLHSLLPEIVQAIMVDVPLCIGEA